MVAEGWVEEVEEEEEEEAGGCFLIVLAGLCLLCAGLLLWRRFRRSSFSRGKLANCMWRI